MLESSARFHAADGLAVCVPVFVCVCVLIGGACGMLDGVCIGMSGVYFINVSIDFAFLRGGLNLLCKCWRSCTFAYLCDLCVSLHTGVSACE